MVTLEALEPFRVAGPVQEPPPLPYLQSPAECGLRHSPGSLAASGRRWPSRTRISASNCKHLYWNICQQIAHHTVNGCNLRPGDLLASGTISGPTPDSLGSLLELTWKGHAAADVRRRRDARDFSQDGDRVTMTGWCQGQGYRVGFGEVTGKLLPAKE